MIQMVSLVFCVETSPNSLSADEVDTISTRALAVARYKRNHDWMNEVFHQAAFGLSYTPVRSSTP